MKNDEVYEPAFLRHSTFNIQHSIFSLVAACPRQV
jgi:hypothetical protein